MFRSANSTRIFALAFFILMLMNGLSAQSWMVISRNDTLNYKRSSSIVPMPDVVVRVISEEISGSDTILNLNKRAYVIENYKALINQPIFLQKKIIIKPTGLVVLSDTATYQLYPSATIGTNWLFNPSTGVTAEVISINAEDVLGIPDSVKTILLSDGNQIKISKKWGICSFPEFNNPGVNFVLTGIDNQRIGEFFWNHIDFAHSMAKGDIYCFDDLHQHWGIHYGDHYFESTKQQFTINSKTVTDTTVEYTYTGVSHYFYEYFDDNDIYTMISGKLVYPIVYTPFQLPTTPDRIRDKFPGDYMLIAGHYCIVQCNYDSPLQTVRKVVGGRPYNRLSQDTLYFDDDINTTLYFDQFQAINGIPWMLTEHQFVDNYNYSDDTYTRYLYGWRKSWGGGGSLMIGNPTSEIWPVISKTDTMNFKRSNSLTDVPDESVWVTSIDVQGNDTTFHLNKKVVHTEDDYYVLQPSKIISESVQSKQDKSVLLLGENQFMLYPTGGLGYYWLFDESKHISASIESIVNTNVLGMPDKIKTILLSDGNRIKLSKRWGLFSFPDFNQEGVTYNLTGIENQEIGEQTLDHSDFVLGWEVGNLYRTREGRIENLNNGTINEYITHKQFEVKGKTVTDSTVMYLVSGYRWEELPQEPIRYYPYNDILEFSLEHAPFVGHDGLGKMLDKFNGDTLTTRFNGNSYIHAVELYYDSLCQTTGKRIFGPPFHAIRNDTLIPAIPEVNSLFDCRYDALPGLPTVLYSDKYYGSDLEDSQTFFSEIVAWSTPECTYGEFITNPLGLADTDLPEDVIIYPNPFANTLHIIFQKDTGIHLIEIFDLSGIPVYTTSVVNNTNSLDLAHLSEGMYFVKITGKTGIVPIRIVKLK